jgi:hypothetical protein
VPAGLGKQTPHQRRKRRFSLRVHEPREGANAAAVAPSTPGLVVVELDVTLISLDSSADANQTKPQFDAGGEG